MQQRMIYLESYDRYDEILAYELGGESAWCILNRSEAETLGLPLSFGCHTRETDHVLGVVASPEGPVFFVDAEWITGPLGSLTATVEVTAPASRERHRRDRRCFTLCHEGAVRLRFNYEERVGIGANPYDQEVEDVDLAALIASRMAHSQFFVNYTRDWV